MKALGISVMVLMVMAVTVVAAGASDLKAVGSPVRDIVTDANK